MGGQRRTAARAVGHNLKTFIQKSLIPDLLERPPLGLNKVVVISHIRVVHISPETHRAGEVLPHAFVFPYRLLTFADKRVEAILLDLFLAVQSQKLFHLKLHGKPVGIPTGLSGHHTPLHGAVSGNHILNYAGQHMADMGLAVGRRRAVIKGIGGTVLARVHAFLKDIVLFPEKAYLFFSVNKIQVCVNFLIHSVHPF